MSKNYFLRKIKGSLIVRAIAWPYMTIKKKIIYEQYHQTNEGKKLENLCDAYNGKRCFIVGNGSSLQIEDLDRIKNELTFGSNRIYNLFDKTEWRPTFYLAEDEDGYSEMLPIVLKYEIPNYVFSLASKKFEPDNPSNIYHGLWTNKKYVINRYNDRTSHISENLSDYFSDGYSVTFSAIQLAIYMGVTEIYLIGVDFNYTFVTNKYGKMKKIDGISTYFDGKERDGSYLNYYSTIYAYKKAKEYADEHGIKIYNATRGGKLEVFERINFDDIF